MRNAVMDTEMSNLDKNTAEGKANSTKSTDIGEIAHEFGANATAHGFSRVVATDNKTVKVVWIIICGICWGVFIWQAITFIKKYYAFEVTYSITVGFKQLAFPAVTVCNMNPLRQNHIDEIEPEFRDGLGFLNFNLSAGNGTSDGNQDDDDGNTDTSDGDYGDYGDYFAGSVQEVNLSSIMAKLPEETRARVGHQKVDFIQECVFNGISCSARNFSLVLNPKYGNCYTFNDALHNAHTLYTIRPGPAAGLKLTLFIEQNEYLRDYTENAGAVVLIHPNKEAPFPEEQGLELPPGFSTSVGIRLSEVVRLGGVYSKCRHDSSNIKLVYEGHSYSMEACMKTCFQRHLIDECHCFEGTIPTYGLNDTVMPCVDTFVGKQCRERVYDYYRTDQLECSQCYQPCSGKSYKEMVSMSVWPSDAYDNKLFGRLSQRSSKITEQLPTTEDSRRNLLQLKVYFSELNYESINEKPAFDQIALLSNLGGLMGLYIGASVISLFEFLEFLGKLCLLIPKKSGS